MSDEQQPTAQQPTQPATQQPAQPDTFFAALPDDLRNNELLAKTGGKLDQLARGYIAAQQMLGRDATRMVEIPVDDPDGAATRGILTRLGLPETLDQYTLEAPKDIPETLGLDQPLSKAFIEQAHKAGILPKQAQQVYGWFADTLSSVTKQQSAAMDQQHETNVATLQKEWGQAFDARVAAANFAAREIGGDELPALLESAGLATNPVVMKALAKVGIALSKSPTTQVTQGETTGRFGDTRAPEEIEAQARELQRKAITEKNRETAREYAAAAQKLYAQIVR